MSPSFVVAFFKKSFPIGRGVEPPTESVTQANVIIGACGGVVQGRKLMLGMNANLRTQHPANRASTQHLPTHDFAQEGGIVVERGLHRTGRIGSPAFFGTERTARFVVSVCKIAIKPRL